MKPNQEAAIAAIATAPANGAVGILRVSGRDALAICSRVFRADSGRALADYPPRTLVFGSALAPDGAVLDRCLAVFMPAPHSYTGEDVAELQCHGGRALLALVLSALLSAGARMAEPGEFTRRAFLNGKLDLTQAEAVADLVSADWSGAVKNAASQLSGAYGEHIRALYARVRALAAGFAAAMDYADQNVEYTAGDRLAMELSDLAGELSALADTAALGRIVQEGVRTCVIGRPNAGKSSVFNRLLGYSRSIVTDEAGTTRDVVSEKLVVGGTPLLLSDTAGIRGATSAPERMGVELARDEIRRAGLLLAVFDASAPLTGEDREILSLCEGKCVLCLANKCDLSSCEETIFALQSHFSRVYSLSAVTGEGFDALLSALPEVTGLAALPGDGMLVTNARHADALCRAAAALREAEDALFLSAEDAVWGLVRDACDLLGGILGVSVSEDVEREIFSRFCLGK